MLGCTFTILTPFKYSRLHFLWSGILSQHPYCFFFLYIYNSLSQLVKGQLRWWSFHSQNSQSSKYVIPISVICLSHYPLCILRFYWFCKFHPIQKSCFVSLSKVKPGSAFLFSAVEGGRLQRMVWGWWAWRLRKRQGEQAICLTCAILWNPCFCKLCWCDCVTCWRNLWSFCSSKLCQLYPLSVDLKSDT